MTLNLYDFIGIILWVVLITCSITLAVSFRREIKVVLFRFLVSTGLYAKWLKISNRSGASEGEGKVNYEIYNPNTGQIDDQQYVVYPEVLKQQMIQEQRIQQTPAATDDVLHKSEFFNRNDDEDLNNVETARHLMNSENPNFEPGKAP